MSFLFNKITSIKDRYLILNQQKHEFVRSFPTEDEISYPNANFQNSKFHQTIVDPLCTYVPKQTNSSSSATNVLINFPREIKRPAKTYLERNDRCGARHMQKLIRFMYNSRFTCALYNTTLYGNDNCCVYDKFYYSG